MPRNSKSVIQTYAHCDDAATFGYSAQDEGVFLSNIPAGIPGLVITMPTNPSEGDYYEFADVDGSCGEGNVVQFLPAADSDTTINGGSSQFFAAAGVTGKLVYDSARDNWVLVLGATSGANIAQNLVSTAGNGGPVTPGDLATGTATPIVLFAAGMRPKGVGLVRVMVQLVFTLSAADTVTLQLEAIPNVTSIVGGSEVGSAGPPSLHYETGTGAGQPVVVTGGTPVAMGSWKAQIAAGNIAKVTAVFANGVEITEPTLETSVSAIVGLLSAAGGAHFTSMELSILCQEAA